MLPSIQKATSGSCGISGRLPNTPEAADTAFRISGTGERRVFLLGTAASQGQPELWQSSTQATFDDEACVTTLYQLDSPLPLILGDADLVELLQSDLSIFVQTGADKSGWLLVGTVIEQPANPSGDTPADEARLAVGIDIHSVQTSQVGRLMQVKLSIYNFGAEAIELSADRLSLLVEGGNSLGPTGSKPALPRTIQPGQTTEFEMIFPLPAEGLGTLRVFNSEFELAEYEK